MSPEVQKARGQQHDAGVAIDLWTGRVSRVDGTDVYVVVPGFSERREHGPAVLLAPAGAPVVGDEAVVGFTEEGTAVLLAPGTGGGGGGGGAEPDASSTVKGITKLSIDPAVAANPIAAGTNDARIPTQSENDALVGTSGAPSGTNQYVTNADARNTNARTPTAHAASHLSGGGDTLALTNAEIAAAAGIAYSKLTLTASITNGDIAAAAAIAYTKLNLTGAIVNADIAAAAGIAKSKLAPLNIANADVDAAAAIAYSKLALTGSIVNADIAAGAAIAKSKLAALAIANADVAVGAAIARSKLDFGSGLVDADIAAAAAIAESKLNLATDAAAGTGSRRTLGTGAAQAAAGNDARFPAGADIVNADVDAAAAIAETKLALASDAAAGTASRRTLGSGALQAMAGNTRLDQVPAPTAPVSLNSQKITSLADGTAATDAATKGQVDIALATFGPSGAIGAKALSSDASSITSGSLYTIPFSLADEYDTDAMHDPAVNNTRVIAKTAGIFTAVGRVRLSTAVAGSDARVILAILKNGTVIQEDSIGRGAGEGAVAVQAQMAVNDYFELRVQNGTGGSITLAGGGADRHHLAAALHGPGIAQSVLSQYRTLVDASGSHIAARVAGTYGFAQGQPLAITGTGTLYPLNTIYIAAADFQTVNSLAPKLRVRGQLYVNDVAPTGNFTFGLHPITRPATSGGAGLVIYTIGAAVASSTFAVNAPAADSSNFGASADFALPADGHYVLGVVTTATVAASSHLHLSAMLQARNA